MRLMVRPNSATSNKYTVDITPKLVKQLGWAEHLELEGTVAGDALVLRPKK